MLYGWLKNQVIKKVRVSIYTPKTLQIHVYECDAQKRLTRARELGPSTRGRRGRGWDGQDVNTSQRIFIVSTYKPYIPSGIKIFKIYIKHNEKIKPGKSLWEAIFFFPYLWFLTCL